MIQCSGIHHISGKGRAFMDQQLTIVTTLAEHDRSKVYVALDASNHPVILKKLTGKTALPLIERIEKLDSPYFPKIIELSTEDGNLSVVEEYIEGDELGRLLGDDPLPQDKASDIMTRLLEAVSILHRADPPLIHRDIKPGNIIITKEGGLKLIDFDAAREWKDASRSSDTTLLGTRGYAAPEQFGYSQTDIRSDLYSVGVVCTQICEHSDFSEEKKAALKTSTDKATMFDPKERFQSADEMLEALHSTLEKGSLPQDTEHDGIQKPGMSPLKVAVITSAFIIIAVTAFLLLRLFEHKPSAGDTGSYTGLEVLPEEYRYKAVGPKIRVVYSDSGTAVRPYPGFNPGAGSTALSVPLLYISKESPRDILLYDYHFENYSAQTSLCRYSNNDGTVAEYLKIQSSDDIIVKNGFFCLSADFLNRLKAGRYGLKIRSSDTGPAEDAEWEYHIIILDTDAGLEVADTGPLIPASVQFYSAAVRNDVFFSFYNTSSGLGGISYKGEAVSEKDYLLTKDGLGVVLRSSFFEQVGNDGGPIGLDFEMKNGTKAYAEVIPVP